MVSSRIIQSVVVLALGIAGASATPLPLSCDSHPPNLLNIAHVSSEVNKQLDEGVVVVEGYAEKADTLQHAFHIRVRGPIANARKVLDLVLRCSSPTSLKKGRRNARNLLAT
jgi:hypothetical protein